VSNTGIRQAQFVLSKISKNKKRSVEYELEIQEFVSESDTENKNCNVWWRGNGTGS
jgi:hypothetical protein